MILRFLMLMAMMVSSTFVLAEPLTGLQVIERAKKNGEGFQDMTHELKMILIDEAGGTTEREMIIKALRDSDKSYSMSVFTAPSREKGISLLTVAEANDSDKQYLYLPSTKRVKRITGSNRSSSFRGSEFTFEDLSDQKTADYTFELIKEEPCGELTCYVLDRFPRSEDSSYSKTTLWVDGQHYRLLKADFFDKDKKLLKTMESTGFELAEGKYWSPKLVMMSNHQTGKKTKMESIKLIMNSGLKATEFSELAMRKWR